MSALPELGGGGAKEDEGEGGASVRTGSASERASSMSVSSLPLCKAYVLLMR